jgi:hypothetical protein
MYSPVCYVVGTFPQLGVLGGIRLLLSVWTASHLCGLASHPATPEYLLGTFVGSLLLFSFTEFLWEAIHTALNVSKIKK